MYVLSLHNKKMDNPLILQLLEKLHLYVICEHVTLGLIVSPSVYIR